MGFIIRTLHLVCCLLASYVFSGAGDQVIRYGITYLIEKYTPCGLVAAPALKKVEES